MKYGWSETKPNGQPLEPGTFCWITDLEDGSHPIATYGRNQDEVTEKLGRQNAHAQAAMAAGTRPATVPGTTTPAAPPAAAARFRLTADQVMQYTEDLKNPAKSSEAIVMLQANATGVDPAREAEIKFGQMATEWENETPGFYRHPGNRALISQALAAKVGGRWGAVTKAMLTEVFEELQAHGLLFEEQPEAQPQPTPTPSSFPVESQVQQTERPRRMFSTGARSSSFGAPQRASAQPKALKYTEVQIRTMPIEESERIMRAGGQAAADYNAACERYFPTQQRTA
jgi:hypothetical protein